MGQSTAEGDFLPNHSRGFDHQNIGSMLYYGSYMLLV